MRAFQLKQDRLDEKRSLLKRFTQMAGSLFDNDKMKERAKNIVADQYESGWRSFATSASSDESIKEPVKQGDTWMVRWDHLIQYFVRQGIDEQIATSEIKKVVGSEFKDKTEDGTSYATMKDKNDDFFRKIIDALWVRGVIVINDPDKLLNKVKGETNDNGDYVSGGTAELTQDEEAGKVFAAFKSWAKSSGIDLDDEDKDKIREAVRKWIRNDFLSGQDENVLKKVDEIVTNANVRDDNAITKLFKAISQFMTENFIYDAKNNKVRTADDSENVYNVAQSGLTAKAGLEPNNAETYKALAKELEDIKNKEGAATAIARKKEDLQKAGVLLMNDDGSITDPEIEGAKQPEEKEEKDNTPLIDPEVKKEAIQKTKDIYSAMPGKSKPTDEEIAQVIDGISQKDVDNFSKDGNLDDSDYVSEIAYNKLDGKINSSENPKTFGDFSNEMKEKFSDKENAEEVINNALQGKDENAEIQTSEEAMLAKKIEDELGVEAGEMLAADEMRIEDAVTQVLKSATKAGFGKEEVVAAFQQLKDSDTYKDLTGDDPVTIKKDKVDDLAVELNNMLTGESAGDNFDVDAINEALKKYNLSLKKIDMNNPVHMIALYMAANGKSLEDL